MDAKTYCKKTAAFAGWLIQNVPADLDEETMDDWMSNPDGTKKFLSGLKPPKTISVRPAPLLSVIATTKFDAIAGKKTKKCFTGSRWVYRDDNFDNWLAANQPSADACAITTLTLLRDWMFAEAAAAVLGIGSGTSTALLGKALIENGYTMTLAQAEEMVEKTDRGENTGMRTDGYGNFFFIETGDEGNPVSVGRVDRGDRDWNALVNQLGNDDRWLADRRLLVCNLKDTPKL